MPRLLIRTNDPPGDPGTASWSTLGVFAVATRSFTDLAIPGGGTTNQMQLAASGLFGAAVLITLQGSTPDATLTSVVYEWISSPGDIIVITGNANATNEVKMTVIIFEPLS